MSNVNYKQIYARKAEAEKLLKQVCPEAAVHKSGIYFYTREDDDGKFAYIGKAVDLCERSISHINGYSQRIDISLKPKNRGFYSKHNPSGWKLNVLYYPKYELDKWEQHWIKHYQMAGVHLYNIESGGTDGKTLIGERKPSRGYHDGLAQGRKSLAKDLAHIIKTHNFKIEPEKHNKVTEKALAKFWELLESESEDV